jgi:hypothetical protein
MFLSVFCTISVRNTSWRCLGRFRPTLECASRTEWVQHPTYVVHIHSARNIRTRGEIKYTWAAKAPSMVVIRSAVGSAAGHTDDSWVCVRACSVHSAQPGRRASRCALLAAANCQRTRERFAPPVTNELQQHFASLWRHTVLHTLGSGSAMAQRTVRYRFNRKCATTAAHKYNPRLFYAVFEFLKKSGA